MSQGINVERESAARSTLTRTDWVTGPLAQARVFTKSLKERELRQCRLTPPPTGLVSARRDGGSAHES